MVTVADVNSPAWNIDGEMVIFSGNMFAMVTWTVAAPPFKFTTRVPCTAVELAVMLKVTVSDEADITLHVTSGSAVPHVA
jgi:hypothetical protein